VPSGNAAPFADPGPGSVYLVGTPIPLNGSDSFDPDGRIATFRWRLAGAPAGSVGFPDATVATTSFTPIVAGAYAFDLTVEDDGGASATARVTDVVTNPVIHVAVGPSVTVPWHTTVALTASYTVEANLPATIGWTIVAQPATSTAKLTGATTLTPSFVPDADGDFVIRFDVATAYTQASASLTVTARVPRVTLPYHVIDVEYSRTMERLIAVSDGPPQLHVFDPETGLDVASPLAVTPTSVSIEPGGPRAAIGHDGSVTVVNLQTKAATRYPTTGRIVDIVFGADARVHGFTAQNDPYFTLSLPSGATFSPVSNAVMNTAARLSPDHWTIYSLGLAVLRWDVAVTPVALVGGGAAIQYASNLWFTPDGGSLLMNDGSVRWASADPAIDTTLRTSLAAGTRPRWADGSLALNTLFVTQALLDNTYSVVDEQLAEYDATTLALRTVRSIPDLNAGDLVAIRGDGTRLYVLTKGAANSTVFRYDP
jgi:hypothetical protein